MTGDQWLAFEAQVREERSKGWREIELAALEQARVDMAKDESTPLAFGQPIAWSFQCLGRTHEFTELHRVGFPNSGYAYTSCGELIPEPVRWLPLSSAMIWSMPRCKTCKEEHARQAKEHAA